MSSNVTPSQTFDFIYRASKLKRLWDQEEDFASYFGLSWLFFFFLDPNFCVPNTPFAIAEFGDKCSISQHLLSPIFEDYYYCALVNTSRHKYKVINTLTNFILLKIVIFYID